MVDWERIWRGSGIGAALFFIVAYIFYGSQPKVGAATDKIVSHYDGDSTRILIATVIVGFGILNLTWFAAALTSVLRDAGKGGWGTAASAAGRGPGRCLLRADRATCGPRVLDRRLGQLRGHLWASTTSSGS